MIYVFIGDEPFIVKKRMNEVLKKVDPERNQMDTVFFDGAAKTFSIKNIIDECNAFSLFNDKKVVIVENPAFLLKTYKINDTDYKLIEQYSANPNPNTELLFIGDIKIDTTKKVYKLLKKCAEIEACNRMSDQDFIHYVHSVIHENHLSFTPDAMVELENRLPNDINTFYQELEKLKIFGTSFKKEDIEKLVTRTMEADHWKMINAIVNKQTGQALKYYRDLDELGIEPIYLTIVLAGNFRFMYQVKVLSDKGMSKDSIAKELKAHPYRTQLALNTCRNLSKTTILRTLRKLADLDQGLKNGTVDRSNGLEYFIVRNGI